jgi:hypothetical protein
MTYAYVIRDCEPYEGCTDKFISLDMKKTHDVYLKLKREEILDYSEYHRGERCELHNKVVPGGVCCGRTSSHQSGIYTSRWEINQVLLDKEYDHDISEEEGQV